MVSRIKNRVAKLLPKKAFARSVSILVGGTAGAQLLTVLAAPLLTRLYSPEDFGLLAVYAGLLAMLAVVASLRYEMAIPLPESDKEAASIVILSLLIVVIVTLITAGMVWLADEKIANLLNVPQLTGVFWLLPMGVLLLGTYNVFNYWGVRTKQFPVIARTRISQALTTLAIQVLGFKAGGVALVVGQTGGQGMGGLSLARPALRNPSFRKWCWVDVQRAAKRYRNFPLLSTWSGLFNAAGRQLPPLMFAALFGASAAGLYALAHRVLALPMSLVGDAIGKVFFANAAEAHRKGNLDLLVKEVHGKLAKIAMPPAAVLMIIGPDIFALIFGEAWRLAGEFARWMSPWLYIVFITSPLSTLISVMEKQREDLLFQIALLVSRMAAIAVGAWYGDLLLAVILFSGVSVLCWMVFLIWVTWITGNNTSMLVYAGIQALSVSVLVSIPLLVGGLWPASTVVWWVALVACAGLIMFHYWHLFNKEY